MVGVVIVVALVVGAAVLVGVGQLVGWNDDETAGPPTSTVAGGAAALDADRFVSTVAEAKQPQIEVFDKAGGTVQQTIDRPDDPPRPLVFLVIEASPDWYQVLLPVRPNQSKGWVRAADVDLRSHEYRIVVELNAHRFTLYNGPALVMRSTVGLGRDRTPTPGGLYYIKELLQVTEPDSVYGPYAYGLSGFSNVLTTFAGGPGVVGLHGTNDATGLGRDVSAGCIRMPNEDIVRLVEEIGLPLGVPVDIRP
jgi:lipoprotein-anchoring transpeptidase ErfK/SrfK